MISNSVCSCVSIEELYGVYKTLLLFLEAQNFQETVNSFKKECEKLGCGDILQKPGKVLLCKSFSGNKNTGNQTNLSATEDVYILESLCHNCCCHILETASSKSSGVTYLCTKPINTGRNGNGEPIAESERNSRKTETTRSPQRSGAKTERRSPKKDVEDEINKIGPKVIQPIQNSKYNENQNNDAVRDNVCTLRTQFEHLQNEHQKLLKVTSHLTSALQANIIGQTRNMNEMLCHCKNIYPDLFSSPRFSHEIINHDQVLTTPRINHDQVLTTPREPPNTASTQATMRLSNGWPGTHEHTCENLYRPFHEVTVNYLQIVPNTISSPCCLPEESDFCQRPSEPEQLDIGITYPDVPSLNLEETIESSLENHQILENSPNVGVSTRREISDMLNNCVEQASASPKLSGRKEDAQSARNEATFILDMVFQDATNSTRLSEDDQDTSNKERTKETTDEPSCELNSNIVKTQNVQAEDEIIQMQFRKFASPRKKFRDEFGFQLNYDKIKNDLMTADIETKIRLLQALRWRITVSKQNVRDRVLMTYTREDLLGLLKRNNLVKQILQGDSSLQGEKLHESFSRLINALASVRRGRDYLTSNDHFLCSVLLPYVMRANGIMESPPSSSVTRDMLIATLQKLSLRRDSRWCMLEQGFLEFLVKFLEQNYNTVSTYCLEYCCALFMNLCLEPDARKRCAVSAEMSSKIVGLLKKLLEAGHYCCFPYVNGCLYSLLSQKELNRVARFQQLDVTVYKEMMKMNDPHLRQQLEFILRSRFADPIDQNASEPELEIEEEVDFLESELDEGEPVDKFICGERLLDSYRLDLPDSVGDHISSLYRPASPAIIRQSARMTNRSTTYSEQNGELNKPPISTVPGLVQNEETYICEAEAKIPSVTAKFTENAKSDQLSSQSQSTRQTSTFKTGARIFNTDPHCLNPHATTTFNAPKGPTRNNKVHGMGDEQVNSRRTFPTNYTSLCYMDRCKRGEKDTCTCCKCSGNKYSCGCYEAIREDLEIEEKRQEDQLPPYSFYEQGGKRISRNLANVRQQVHQTFTLPEWNHPNLVNFTETQEGLPGDTCVCEGQCNCAFESRPKICRTP